MKLKTIANWTIVAVMLLASLVSIAWANHTIALFSVWSDTNGDSLSVNQGTPADLFVYVSSNSDFYLSIKVYRGTTLVQNVPNSVFVPANSANDYSNEFSISTVALAGKHTVEVLADPVGADTFENKVLELDVESSPTVNPLPDQDVDEGQTLQFTASGSDQDGDTVTYVARKNCQGDWIICSLGEILIPNTENNLYSGMSFNQQSGQFSYSPNFATVKHPASEREFPLKIRAHDNSNQWSAWEYVTVTVNDVNQLPQFTSVPVTDATENAYYAQQLTATDADTEDELTFSLVSGPEGMLITPNDVLRWTPTFEQAGNHDVTLQVSDSLAATEQSFTITVENTNRAPELAPIGNKQVNEREPLAFTVSASDADGDLLSLTTTNLPAGATFNQQSGQFSWTPSFEQAGTYQVTFRAIDAAGDLDLETITITVVNVNRAPVVAVVDDQSVDEGIFLQFVVSATDADGDSLIFATSGWPAGATLVNSWDGTATFSWTPSFSQAGTYELTFSVADSSTFVQETFTVTVRDVTQPSANQAPILNPIGNQQVDEGEPLVIVVDASDADGDTLTFSTGTLPAGATFNAATRTFSWAPGFDQAGTYAVAFAVSDGQGGMDTELVWITVNDVVVPPGNQAPVLDPIGSQSVDEGELLQFTVTASDPDGDALTLTAVQNLPPGATFNEATGEFSWTPGFNQAGEYPGVTLSVTDGLLFDAETITITVNDIPQPQPVPGCTDPAATNFNPNATQDDGSCTYPPQPVLGCTDSAATNFNPNANTDDGSCTYPPQPVLGCTDANATNYNPDATQDDGSCVYPPANQAPTTTSFTVPSQLTVAQAGQFTVTATDADGDPLSYSWTFGDGQTSTQQNPTHAYGSTGQYTVTVTVSDGQATVTDSGTVTVVPAVVPGCTEPTALNFNPQATFNDGSCQFSGKNVAIATVQMPDVASAGDYLTVNVVAKNSGNEQLKNLQITVLAYDLNTFGSSNKFTLNPGKSTSKLVYVPLPYDAWPGSYLIKITVDNGVARDSTYRQVWVQ